MTTDKARKAAARERAARTGERYVVARRAIDAQPETHVDGALHRLMHRVPGVPEHVEGGLRGRPNGLHRPHVHTQPRRREPRVLVGLQHRIARLLGAE